MQRTAGTASCFRARRVLGKILYEYFAGVGRISEEKRQQRQLVRSQRTRKEKSGRRAEKMLNKLAERDNLK